MIDQDYEELLNRTPPSGDVLEWTFSTRALANAFVSLLLGTPALCLVLYCSGLSGEEDPRDGAELRVSVGVKTKAKQNWRTGFVPGLFLAVHLCYGDASTRTAVALSACFAHGIRYNQSIIYDHSYELELPAGGYGMHTCTHDVLPLILLCAAALLL